jgi:hypothetical protein
MWRFSRFLQRCHISPRFIHGFARKKIADAGAFREGIPLVTCWNSDIIILRIIFPSAAGPEGSLAYEERYTACFVSQ